MSPARRGRFQHRRRACRRSGGGAASFGSGDQGNAGAPARGRGRRSASPAVACRGHETRLARPAERRHGEGCRAGASGEFPRCRTSETLYDARHGRDQGRTSNVLGLAIMAELTGKTIAETGTTIYRPPYTPTPIAAFAGRSVGVISARRGCRLASLGRRTGRRLRRGRKLAWRAMVPARGRDGLAPVRRPRGAGNPRLGRRLRCQHAWQDRHPGADAGAFSTSSTATPSRRCRSARPATA